MHNHKRKSIFKILLLKIFGITIILNAFLAVATIGDAVKIHKQGDEINRGFVKNELLNLTQMMNNSFKSLEEVIYNTQSEIVSKIDEIGLKTDLKTVDLNKTLLQLEMDTSEIDIYIIEKTVIVNTTYKKDLGLDFRNFGSEHIAFLKDVQNSGEFVLERFTFETSTGRPKIYSYMATSDGKYIIEIGSYSKIADIFTNLLRERITEYSKSNKDVVSANIWVNKSKPHSLIEDTLTYFNQDSLLFESFYEEKDTRYILKDKHKFYFADYIYLNFGEDSHFYPEVVASIMIDLTGRRDQVKSIIKKQVSFTLIFFLILMPVVYLSTRDFNKTLKEFLRKTSSIAEGNFHERVTPRGNTEFTTLAEQFNSMVEKLETSYNDLTDKNIQIEENNYQLVQQNEEILAQRDEIEAQRDEIEAQRNFAIDQRDLIEQQKIELVDSIEYAKKIQQSILPAETYIKKVIPEYFIYFKPRDIVSGDFYWIRQIYEHLIIVAADCTGHGVPGAIMSILGTSLLNEIVRHNKNTEAGSILTDLRKQVKKTLKQKGNTLEAKDGMDMALCVINTETNVLQFSGAYNPLYLIRDGELIEFKGDRMPVGIHVMEKPRFETKEVELKEGDTFYIFSDGYPDQIGGPREKKFMLKNFKLLLQEIHHLPMKEQKCILDSKMIEWKGERNQLDDMLIVGFRYLIEDK